MTTIFFISIIYLSFISLGLPDAMLGAAWPVMRGTFRMPLEAAGLVAAICTCFSLSSSLATDYLVRKLGIGKLNLISCICSAAGLLGYAMAPNYTTILLSSILLGLGGGAIDASINSYVAKNYSSRFMNWLHCSWGIGAMTSPLIFIYAVKHFNSWRQGYTITSIIQFAMAFLLIFSLPLWDRNQKKGSSAEYNSPINKKEFHRDEKVWISIAIFYLYVGTEVGVGLWAGSLMVDYRHAAIAVAGTITALYFGAIMGGRFISGLISEKLGNRRMIQISLYMSLIGTALLTIKSPLILTYSSVLLIGLGLAPIYPSMTHEVPKRFKKSEISCVIGYQAASAQASSLTLTPLIGIIGSRFSLEILPYILGFFIIILIFLTKRLDKKTPVSKIW